MSAEKAGILVDGLVFLSLFLLVLLGGVALTMLAFGLDALLVVLFGGAA